MSETETDTKTDKVQATNDENGPTPRPPERIVSATSFGDIEVDAHYIEE